MAFACVDLRRGEAAEPFLAALTATAADQPDVGHPIESSTVSQDGRSRVWLFADYGNVWLGRVLALTAGQTCTVERVVLSLDHDEYGAEHAVLDGRDGPLCRLHHVYIYPGGQPDGEAEPLLANLPACDGLEVRDDGTVDGPRSWAAAARLFDVSPERLAQSAKQTVSAHENLGLVFTPFAPWWD